MFRLTDADLDAPNTISDVPRPELDGGEKIEVSTGDAAAPCIGVFSAMETRGVLVFTVQDIFPQLYLRGLQGIAGPY